MWETDDFKKLKLFLLRLNLKMMICCRNICQVCIEKYVTAGIGEGCIWKRFELWWTQECAVIYQERGRVQIRRQLLFFPNVRTLSSSEWRSEFVVNRIRMHGRPSCERDDGKLHIMYFLRSIILTFRGIPFDSVLCSSWPPMINDCTSSSVTSSANDYLLKCRKKFSVLFFYKPE